MKLGRSLVLELGPPAKPHVSLVDASRLEAADEGAFSALRHYVEEHRAELQRAVHRLALVRPGGILGAMVAGAYEVMKRPYPVEIFSDAESALEWLGVKSAGSPASVARALEQLHAQATGASPELTTLRAWLDAHLDGAKVTDAATQLELSARTLQRRLGDAGTSFERELMDARVRAAKRLLHARDAKLTTIAHEAGFASLQQLNTVFKRATGLSPREFRENSGSSARSR
ncbi:MAG: AraC family transcriptional regulator [Myxococcaceae bacterium]